MKLWGGASALFFLSMKNNHSYILDRILGLLDCEKTEPAEIIEIDEDTACYYFDYSIYIRLIEVYE